MQKRKIMSDVLTVAPGAGASLALAQAKPVALLKQRQAATALRGKYCAPPDAMPQ